MNIMGVDLKARRLHVDAIIQPRPARELTTRLSRARRREPWP